MSQKRHETTSGASANEGREYEDVLSTYLCLKASYDEDCRHFELASNVKGYGSADDVIFRKDGELFLVQLKWKQNAGVINRLSFKFLWHTTPHIFRNLLKTLVCTFRFDSRETNIFLARE
jgi:hypothetical protein